MFLLEGIFHLARTKQEIDDLQRVLSEHLEDMMILKLVGVHSKEEVEVVPSFPRNLQQETHILSDIDTVKSNEVFNVLQ